MNNEEWHDGGVVVWKCGVDSLVFSRLDRQLAARHTAHQYTYISRLPDKLSSPPTTRSLQWQNQLVQNYNGRFIFKYYDGAPVTKLNACLIRFPTRPLMPYLKKEGHNSQSSPFFNEIRLHLWVILKREQIISDINEQNIDIKNNNRSK